MNMKHDTLDSWVAAFEKWSGLKVEDYRPSSYDHDGSDGRLRTVTAYKAKLLSSTGVCIGTLDIFKSTDEGWKFGGCSTVFPEDWKTLCRM